MRRCVRGAGHDNVARDPSRGPTTGAKLTVEKEVVSGVTASFGSTVGETDDTQNELTLDYKLNETISVQGIYEDRQETEGQDQSQNGNSLGVDLKFKWNY